MRRWLVALGIGAAIGCGLDIEGNLDPPFVDPAATEGGSESSLPGIDGSSSAEGSVGDAAREADVVLPPADAEADRPDAGILFVPNHIQPVYSLSGGNFMPAMNAVVDTTNRTIKIGGAGAVVSSDIVISDGSAVWSVGMFVLPATVTLTVIGSRPLVVVAASDVEIRGEIHAYAAGAVPGPGGALPAVGAGHGVNGAKSASDASGGGGAGNATPGAAGGDKNLVKGGAPGPVTTVGATLTGGSGGGNGGAFVLGVCADHGRGGAGGGALQISAIGKITIFNGGGIDVSGGGGAGGCKDNSSDAYTGGGGGGAGGVVVLESVAGVDLQTGARVAASGSAGGEGGDFNAFGNPGEDGVVAVAIAVARGGTNTAGGDGGNGGYGNDLAAAKVPTVGLSGDASGGGGGATGRLLVGTRAPSDLVVNGAIAAQRTPYTF